MLARSSSTIQVPHIVAAFQSPASLHLITTYAAYGTLWDKMSDLDAVQERSVLLLPDERLNPMSEVEARWWAAQMVSAIEWVHRKGFVHRYVMVGILEGSGTRT